MTKSEWQELEFISVAKTNRDKIRYAELIKQTEEEDEHPPEYDGPCFCRLCRSYN
jgi:hypothetical protein